MQDKLYKCIQSFNFLEFVSFKELNGHNKANFKIPDLHDGLKRTDYQNVANNVVTTPSYVNQQYPSLSLVVSLTTCLEAEKS